MIARWRTLSPYWRRTTLRLALLPLIWILITIAVFLTLYVFPTRDAAARIAGQGATEEQLERIRDELGLDDPYHVQYLDWIGGMLTGDFGITYRSLFPVRGEIERRLPPSLGFMLVGAITTALIAAGASWVARRDIAAHRATMLTLAAIASVPVFVLIVLYILVPSYWWNLAIAPVGDYRHFWDDPWINARQVIIPAIATTVPIAAFISPVALRWQGRTGSTIYQTAGAAVLLSIPLLLSTMILWELVLAVDGVGSFLFVAALVRDLNVVRTLIVLMCIPYLLTWAFLPLDLIRRPEPRSPQTTFARGTACVGLALLAMFAFAAVSLPPLLDDPRAFNTANTMSRPSLAHPLGTTQLGQDIFSRVVAGIGAEFKFLLIPLFAGFLPAVALATVLARAVPSLRTMLAEAASAVILLPILPFALVYAAGNGPGVRAASVTATLFAAALGILTALALAGTSASTRKDRIAIGSTLAAAACVVAFVSVLTETTCGYLGFGAEIATPNLGIDFAYGSTRGSEYLHLLYGPAVVLCLFLFTFLLIRTALDDLDPPNVDER